MGHQISNRKYKRKLRCFSEEDMECAVEEVITRRMTYTEACKTFNVSRASLSARINKAHGKLCKRGEYKPVFNDHQHKELTRIILFMEKRLFLLSKTDLRSLAFEFAVKHNTQHKFDLASKLAGRGWLEYYLKCNPELKLRMSEFQPKGFNRESVTPFFSLLSAEYEKYNFPPDRIWNADATVINTSTSRIFPLRGGRKQIEMIISSEKGKLVTVEVCMNAAGSFMPLMFVFPSRKANLALVDRAPPGSLADYHESGWMQKEIFIEWFKRFIDIVKPSVEKPIILLLDADTTFTKSLELIYLAQANHVTILCFPAYCTRRLQPLDNVFVAALNRYYLQEVQNWRLDHFGQSVTISHVAELYGAAFNKVATKQTALDSFRNSGIFPLNPNDFLDSAFGPSDSISVWPSHPANESSALLMSDCLPSTSSHMEPLNHKAQSEAKPKVNTTQRNGVRAINKFPPFTLNTKHTFKTYSRNKHQTTPTLLKKSKVMYHKILDTDPSSQEENA